MRRIEPRSPSVTLFSTLGAWAMPFGTPFPAEPMRVPWLARSLRGLTAAIERAVDALLTWHERAQMRRQLLMLDDRLLKDIGITRLEAMHEAEKPFWRV
ncbi:MAG TPA: DUF1127 domain-containing protein [Geminicoccaceae bacterium]|nr:DUF1127 domain-containing protein [Geminicoccaceae bacterium]